MHSNQSIRGMRAATLPLAALVLAAGIAGLANAGPINPEVYRKTFEESKKTAEVVADVRVLTVVCTQATKEGDKVQAVTLQVALQMLAVEKGPAKKNEIVVVSRQVTLPAGPGPRSYGYMGALRQFPFTPGVKGSVALRWDNDARAYTPIAGWVPEPNNAEIPKEVGKSISARE
jgi:hypothetical protein